MVTDNPALSGHHKPYADCNEGAFHRTSGHIPGVRGAEGCRGSPGAALGLVIIASTVLMIIKLTYHRVVDLS